MKFKFILLPLLFILGHTTLAQNLISASFSEGFVGDYAANNKSTSANYLTSYGWSNFQFTQNSSSTIFVAQGNDIIGNVLITDNNNIQHSIPGYIKWRAPSGSVTTMVFVPTGTTTLATNTGTYVINTTKYIGLTFNGSVLTITTSGSSAYEVTGNAATSGLLSALNTYYNSQPKFSAGDISVSEGVGSATVTVTLSASSGSATYVNYTTSDSTATYSDYTTTAGTLTFTAGTTVQTFTIPIIDDLTPESSERIKVILSNPVGAAIADNTGIVTITDNDGGSNVDVVGSLSTFTSCAGTVSAEQNFSVSGSGLTNDLIVTAPTGFEISLVSGGTFSSSISIVPTGVSVSSTIIYIRLKSNASSAEILQISISSVGASTINLSTGVSTVNLVPTISLGTVSNVNSFATSFSIPFSATTGDPDQYSLVTSSPALSGFVPISNAAGTASPLIIPIPQSATGSYGFTLTIKNSVTGCINSGNSLTLTIVAPTASNDLMTISNDGTASINILTNDQFSPGSFTRIVRRSAPNAGTAQGTVNFNALTGVFTYTRASGEIGNQTVGYEVTNFAVSPEISATALITIMTCDLADPSSDCDGDGVPNGKDTVPSDPCVYPADQQVFAFTTEAWKSLDCDGDGVTNGKELSDGTSPSDGCSYLVQSVTLSTSVSWKAADCDGDGTPNGTDSAPLDYCVGRVGFTIPKLGTAAYNNFFKNGDCDGDGISNHAECNGADNPDDFDGDGIPNYLDTDSDNDMMSDRDERRIDSDGDGDADYLDLDSDNDGILDKLEGNADADGDGIKNYLDLDSDGDGIKDAWEAAGISEYHQDYNFDGRVSNADGSFPDANGNGLADFLESSMGGKPRGPQDTDKDGIPDYLDLDSDGDSLLDSLEQTYDVDGDGRPNYRDLDSDGDWIADFIDGTMDTDADGTKNFMDLDSDGDGIPDRYEGSAECDNCTGLVDNNTNGWDDRKEMVDPTPTDTDGDGTPDFKDLDSDNDGIPDSVEAGKDPSKPVDTDGDGTPDFRDTDSDNDGIPDSVEAGKDPNKPLDTDGDGKPDYLDTDSDNDGIPDSVEAGKDPSKPVDTDGDGKPDYQDTDSDNDGIPDRVEAGKDPNKPVDTDGDGKPDYQDTDSDNDGIPDSVEAGKDPNKPVDTDGDGKPDYLDLDSDADGIPDAVEAGKDPNKPVDTDGDGKPDYIDTDSDNDGIPDSVEAGKDPSKPVDTDGDGKPDYLDTDSDNDGIPDSVEAGKDPQIPVDTDKDGIADFRDLDSDNDSIVDKIEAGVDPSKPVDTDSDSKPDYQDTDSDNDSIPDKIEAGMDPSKPVDTDGDGKPDYQDLDSDNDGIPDKLEAGSDSTKPVDTDSDGTPDYRDLDSDNDGFSDKEEAGKDPNNPMDSDKDGKPDFQDVDSDGDGVLDRLEDDVNFGAIPDCDRDGIPNRIDQDVCQTFLTQGFSPNGDGVNDKFVIPGLLGMGKNKLSIFNRWGNIVYENEDYKNDWGGKATNVFDPLASDGLLPDGVYYYVIDFNGSRPAMSNYLFINRLAK